MDKNDLYIYELINVYKLNVKKKYVYLVNIIGKIFLKVLNVYVIKVKFDFIFIMWICNMEI